MGDIAFLVISLGVILLGAELFVNGVEWVGKLCDLSEGAVGSVLAAVGTALPETIIPIVAILFAGPEGREIGIGAILGAPLMLSTLAMFATGLAVIIFKTKRRTGTKLLVSYSSLSRDMIFFMIVFTMAVLAGVIPPELRRWQLMIGIFMIVSYLVYVCRLFSEKRCFESESHIPPCHFARNYYSPPAIRVACQVLAALFCIIVGADFFVYSLEIIATTYSVPAFVLALIITPIATELPEKFNSLIWVSRDKDNLALGNITGAMVFQSSLIPALGIFLTDWQLNSGAFISAILTMGAVTMLYFQLIKQKHISAGMLLLCGVFYGVFLLAVFNGIITG